MTSRVYLRWMPADDIQVSLSRPEAQVLHVLLGRLSLKLIQPLRHAGPPGLPSLDLVKDAGLKPEDAAALLPRIRDVLGFAAVDEADYQNEVTLLAYFGKRLGKDHFDPSFLEALVEPPSR